MQYFDFPDDDQVATVHEASLEVLGEVGLLVRNRLVNHIPKTHMAYRAVVSG